MRAKHCSACSGPDCGWQGNADHNAAVNVRNRAWQTIQQQESSGGRDSRRQTVAAGKPQPKTKAVPNK